MRRIRWSLKCKVRMIQRRQRRRLRLEPRPVATLRQQLQGHVPVRPPIPRLIHTSHSTRADLREDLVWAQRSFRELGIARRTVVLRCGGHLDRERITGIRK